MGKIFFFIGSRVESLDGRKLRALELEVGGIQESIRKMSGGVGKIQIENNNFINVYFLRFDGC
jgi:hypothetical protein